MSQLSVREVITETVRDLGWEDGPSHPEDIQAKAYAKINCISYWFCLILTASNDRIDILVLGSKVTATFRFWITEQAVTSWSPLRIDWQLRLEIDLTEPDSIKSIRDWIENINNRIFKSI